MREILFRGQTRKKGEKVRLDGTPIDSNWVYGGIFPNNKGGDFAIIYQQYPKIEKYTVYAETIGQFTGLTDKNGKKVFEGDIVKISGVYWTGKHFENERVGDVYFYNGTYYIGQWELCRQSERTLEIIGNIHDNPELLEVRE